MIINSVKRPFQKNSGKRPNTSAYYQSHDWKRKVEAIWQRDKSLCQLCLEKGIIHQLERGIKDMNRQGTVDHVIQRKAGGTDELDNLRLIGSNHHATKSAMEGNQMRSAQ
jgi:5-methylcytosine-specific restriction protein A